MWICAACKKTMRESDCRWESSLYKSQHILCEPCGLAEDKRIENAGTNDLPEILKLYGHPNDFDE